MERWKIASCFYFIKTIENVFQPFSKSVLRGNTRESVGGLEIAVETLACGSCLEPLTAFLVLPNFTRITTTLWKHTKKNYIWYVSLASVKKKKMNGKASF